MSDNSEFQLKRLPRFKPRSGIEVMYASIRALFLRELQTRFGHYRIGYVWALIEPTLNVIFLLVAFGALAERTLPGIDYTVFLINGILPFYAFMRSSTKAIGAVQSNQGLLSYRNVKPFDTVLSRTILETLLYFICYILLSLAVIWFGAKISFSYIPQLLFYWFILFLFNIGFACIMMVIGELSDEVGKFISAIFILVYFMSGAMIPLHIVPEQYLIYFLWNPVAHILELMRHAVAPSYQLLNGASLSYVIVSTIIILFLGLALNQVFNRYMVKTK